MLFDLNQADVGALPPVTFCPLPLGFDFGLAFAFGVDFEAAFTFGADFGLAFAFGFGAGFGSADGSGRFSCIGSAATTGFAAFEPS